MSTGNGFRGLFVSIRKVLLRPARDRACDELGVLASSQQMIGVIEALWSGYFSVEYKDVAAYSVLVLVLIFRPSGLLGRPDIEKV